LYGTHALAQGFIKHDVIIPLWPESP
jgi:hypothetical protein